MNGLGLFYTAWPTQFPTLCHPLHLPRNTDYECQPNCSIGKEWPTAVTWRFRNEAGGKRFKCNDKAPGWGRDNCEGTRDQRRCKGRDERMVMYCHDDVATYPPWCPLHSSRGTLQCWPNVLTHAWPVFLQQNVRWYSAKHYRLPLVPSN